jgi:tetratricopeptide (TPR) repeat protein
MQLKDYLTIAVAVLAVVVSVIALIVSTRKQDTEDERTLRSLLNDTISQIHNARIDQAKYRGEHKGAEYVEVVAGLYNYRINSAARLAVYAAEKIPSLVTDIELATIAGAFAWTGDQQKGLQYWEAAIAKSKDRYYEIVNRRDYANFLFTIGNIGAGRDQYKKAIDLSPISDDTSKYTTGYTYRMWGVNERAMGNDLSAKEYFDRAAEAYKAISVEGFRALALADLDRLQQMSSKAISELQPGQPPPTPIVKSIGDAKP